jgi:two-component system sensor histidine kinase RegB
MESTISQNTNRQNLLQLIWLRLIAIIGQVVTILIVHYFLKISLPLTEMFLVLMFLGIVNFISFYRHKSEKNISDKSLFIELICDVLVLTAQLYLSGGISNPFISLFLLQVIIAAILLKRIYAWLIAVITIFSYISLNFTYRHIHALHNHEAGDLFNMHLHGMLISYIIAAVLLLIFVTKIIKNLKDRDKNIYLLKQKSLEEEKVVRMGLLATGAAHELSTPLSTISVILNDWKEMDFVNSQKEFQKELMQDIVTMESQLNRCKKILSDILLSSGKARLEQAEMKLAKEAFDLIIEEWKSTRNPQNLLYNFRGEDAKKIILDDTLIQGFYNIFDNALEESPNLVLIDVVVTKNEINLNVEDCGKGFDKKILQEIGKANITTKNSNGLGLFLAISSLRRFDGTLQIKNLAEKGAKVEIKIPLKNL